MYASKKTSGPEGGIWFFAAIQAAEAVRLRGPYNANSLRKQAGEHEVRVCESEKDKEMPIMEDRNVCRLTGIKTPYRRD